MQHVIEDLYNAGCRNIQFDDCTWGMLADDTANIGIVGQDEHISIEQEANKYLRLNNLVLENLPDDLIINYSCMPWQLSFNMGIIRRICSQ